MLLILFLFTACSADEKEEPQEDIYSPTLTASVKDISPPIITCETSYSIRVGDSFDISSKISVRDNTDADPTMIINGNIDTSKAGTYEIDIMASDKDGNVSHKRISVIVSEPKGEAGTDNKTNKNTSGQENSNKENSTGKQPSSPVQVTAAEKDFPFTEGKTFDDVYKQCMDSGAAATSSGKANTARCEVINDSSGIHIGYHLYFN